VTPFEWDEPRSLKKAVALLDPEDASIRPVAGGTALMLMMKTGVFAPARLVSLAKIEPKYSQIRVDKSGALRIGAMASLSALEQSPAAAKRFPVITRTLLTLSNVRVRNVARVGGALAHGDPHMDLPPLLAALGAVAHVVGKSGTRDIAVQDLYLGYYETVLAKDELIAEVTVPPLKGARTAYMKCTSRSADDWPALNLAVRWDNAEGNTISNPCVIVSAATEKVTRLAETEKILAGSNGDEKTMRSAGDAAVEEVLFLSDAHGSAAYKKELLRVYLSRAVRQAQAMAAP
jgi:aerobic carbon-monoxide dehydrogenase medium subunit